MFSRFISTTARRSAGVARSTTRNMATASAQRTPVAIAPMAAAFAGLGASALAYYNSVSSGPAHADGWFGGSSTNPGNFGRFSGRVAAVTGGADGLGKGIAKRLIAEGCKVMLLDFDSKKGEATAAELGENAAFYKVDVSDYASVARAMEATADAFGGRIDIMVNCAGIVGPTKMKIDEVDVNAFDRVYAVNLRGSFNVTKAVLPYMNKNDYGRILLIASIAGKEGNAGMSAYSTSKAGVIGLVKAAGKEYAETNITINGLCPAVIRTQMVMDMPAEQVKYMTDKIPMKRCGTVEEVAATAAFIVSEEASFNTATCFDLTGGRATY